MGYYDNNHDPYYIDRKKELHAESKMFETGAAVCTLIFIVFEIWLWK